MDPAIEAGAPVLGICYGFQIRLTPSAAPWAARAPASTGTEASVSGDFHHPDDQIVWMSHDIVQGAPEGFTVTASTTETPVAAFQPRERRSLRPAVAPRGGPSQFSQDALKNFLRGRWPGADCVIRGSIVGRAGCEDPRAVSAMRRSFAHHPGA